MIASPDTLYAPTFEDLVEYIHVGLLTEAGIDPENDDFDVMKALSACSGALWHTEQFCIETDTDFQELREILNDEGAGCDCEVLLNVMGRIDDDQELPGVW